MWSQVGLRKHHYKASGGDGIPVELFQILKDDAVKALHSICQQIWKTQQWPQDWKMFSFQSQRMLKLPHNCTQSHMPVKYCSKFSKPSSAICEPWTSRCSSCIKEGRGTRNQIANICWITKKAREFQKKKTFISALLTMPNSLIVSQQTGKFLKRWEYQTTWPASWKICMQVRKQQLETDID